MSLMTVWHLVDMFHLKLKLTLNKALDKNSSLSYGMSPAIWDHSVICHLIQVNTPHLNHSLDHSLMVEMRIGEVKVSFVTVAGLVGGGTACLELSLLLSVTPNITVN